MSGRRLGGNVGLELAPIILQAEPWEGSGETHQNRVEP